jgi:hypothetical protein
MGDEHFREGFGPLLAAAERIGPEIVQRWKHSSRRAPSPRW